MLQLNCVKLFLVSRRVNAMKEDSQENFCAFVCDDLNFYCAFFRSADEIQESRLAPFQASQFNRCLINEFISYLELNNGRAR